MANSLVLWTENNQRGEFIQTRKQFIQTRKQGADAEMQYGLSSMIIRDMNNAAKCFAENQNDCVNGVSWLKNRKTACLPVEIRLFTAKIILNMGGKKPKAGGQVLDKRFVWK